MENLESLHTNQFKRTLEARKVLCQAGCCSCWELAYLLVDSQALLESWGCVRLAELLLLLILIIL